jgi:hypothetical protein
VYDQAVILQPGLISEMSSYHTRFATDNISDNISDEEVEEVIVCNLACTLKRAVSVLARLPIYHGTTVQLKLAG